MANAAEVKANKAASSFDRACVPVVRSSRFKESSFALIVCTGSSKLSLHGHYR